MTTKQKIYKKVLDNGLTVLVKPNHQIAKVSVQLWYNVGSKDEQTGQKGIAHLIEHMIFKGTHTLSESDINLITHKLSGYTNAFTSYDYTGYLFDFPSSQWRYALTMLADCMRNCTFKQEFLNSEMKAVIQELKMYKDNYSSSLAEEMVSAVFADHPYHNPIIGYKQDLWSLRRQALVDFYQYHYIPNNAVLVIVGDTTSEQAFELAQKEFGSLIPNPSYKKESFYFGQDLAQKKVTLYRDIAQASVMVGWVIPGAHFKLDYVVDALSIILASGNGSRLYKKLVDELQLVTDIESFNYDLFDHGIFFIAFEPKDVGDIDRVIEVVNQQIEDIIRNGLQPCELERAAKKVEVEYLSLLESNQKQAQFIGRSYLATQDENYLLNYLSHDVSLLAAQVTDLVRDYFGHTVMNTCMVLPLPADQKDRWVRLQERSDQEDARVLSGVSRQTEVEPGVYVNTITVARPPVFQFPQYESCTLPNGLHVLYHHNPAVAKIELILEFKAKHYYDPDDMPGLSHFVAQMLDQGTRKYTAGQLADKIESYGMSLQISAGYISLSMLRADLVKGLQILYEILTDSVFDPKGIEKVRAAIQADIKNYWDTPSQFISQIARERVYGNHPYGKSLLGNVDSITHITRDHLVDFYKKTISPVQARMAIVGDIAGYDLPQVVQEQFSGWQGAAIPDLHYPSLHPLVPSESNYRINRDQVVLAFAGLSVGRFDPDYDKLMLFDQLFTGGSLGSMSSRLFSLREQSGLFYTIGGSLLSRADEQPGMMFIRTIVSLDRMAQARQLIKESIDNAARETTSDQLAMARNALAYSILDNFESNKQTAATFLALDRFKLPRDYFNTRAQTLFTITDQEIKDAAQRLCNTNHLITIQVGRVDEII